MKNNSRLKTILLCVLSFMLGSMTIVSANEAIQALQNKSITIMLNGEEQQFKDSLSGANQYPITYNDRTYLPLRNVAEIAGLSVDYDSETNTAYLNEKDLHLLGHLDFENKLDTFTFIVESGIEKRFDYKISEEGNSITVSTNGVSNTIPTNLTKRIASFSSGINLLDANAFEIPKCIFVVMTDDGCIYESLLTNADLKNVEVLKFFPIVSGANSFNLTFNTQTLGYTLVYYDEQLDWTHIKKLPLITNTDDFDKYFITNIEGYYNEEFRNRLFDVDLDGINDLYYTESLYGKQLVDINMNEAFNFIDNDYIIIQTKTGVYYYSNEALNIELCKLEKDDEKDYILNAISGFSHSKLNEKDLYISNDKISTKETFEEEYNKFCNSEQILKSYPMINSFSELDFEL